MLEDRDCIASLGLGQVDPRRIHQHSYLDIELYQAHLFFLNKLRGAYS